MTDLDFARIVAQHYEALYRFALSLTRDKAESGQLTQKTFSIWATKSHELRDLPKVEIWLFTTLHREFLGSRRQQTGFPPHELDETALKLPLILPEVANKLDTQQVLVALAQLDANLVSPVALFYLQDYSYKEIAEILDLPLGTAKSRLTRGIGQLQRLLFRDSDMGQSN